MNRLSNCQAIQEPDIFRFLDELNKERYKILGGQNAVQKSQADEGRLRRLFGKKNEA